MDGKTAQSDATASDARGAAAEQAGTEWWRGAVIYQIYPRSFSDSNADGIGDLGGIIDKLSYVADLGVDAIWVSPFYESPMNDFGYDVSDYRTVDPMFGDLADFDRLIEAAHRIGLRIIVDQVLSHCSDKHRWFQESRSSRDNPKANWYVWADPKPDGSPPNNWLSVFGGSAWQWEARRKQYYLHNFLVSQPDLNYHEPEVPSQMLEELEFWLQRGVDGVRLDAINFNFHDAKMRDNPAKPLSERKGRGFRSDNPYAWQYHVYDNTRPENLAFLEKLRERCDKYPGVVTLGEISAEQSVRTMRDYTSGTKRLHMAYNFELLVDEFSLVHIRESVESFEQIAENCWPCQSIGNHDVERVATRWSAATSSEYRPKLLNALLLSLRGTVCTYQGEELGLSEAEIPEEMVRDPYGLAFWPLFKGRDGCRTPMPWNGEQIKGGFTNSEPWLPMPEEHCARSVEIQRTDPLSVLNVYRTFTRWRAHQPALRYGDIRFVDSPDGSLCFLRTFEGQTILAGFNFSSLETRVAIPDGYTPSIIQGHGLPGGSVEHGSAHIPANGVVFARLNKL